MSSPLDLEQLAETVALAIDAEMASALDGVLARLKALESREPIHGRDGRDAEPIVGPQGPPGDKGYGEAGKDGAGIAGLVISAEGRLIAHLTDGRSMDAGPIPVKDGAPGRDADLSKIFTLEAEVAALKTALAAQTSGPTLDDILATVHTAIVEEVAKIPAAAGKDADLEIVKQFVTDRIATIPVPRDGKDADAAEIVALVQAEVGTAVAGLPPAKDGTPGTSVSLEDVRPLVDAAVEKAVAALPQPVNGLPGVKGEPGTAGQDGASVGIEDVAPLITAEVHKAIATIPRPADGRPGEKGDPGQSVSVGELAPVIQAEVQKAVAEIPRAANGIPGEKGEPGQSISVEDVGPLILSEVEKAVAALPPAKDGEPGKAVEVADVEPLIVATVAKAVAAIPVPKDGESGPRGERGADGASLSPADLEPLIADHVTKAVAALPQPKDGAPGDKGERGDRGLDGKSLAAEDVAPLIAVEVTKAVSLIPVPKDGVGALGALIDREGHMILTLSDGTVKDLGLIVGRDGHDVDMGQVTKFIGDELERWPKPQNGKDGKDGFGFEHLDLVTDERGVFLRFTRGDVVKEFRLPLVTDQGVFLDGRTYAKGDGVTWAGSFWIAQGETTAKPGTGATAWRLAVKRGGDGKPGIPGLNGKDGSPGRDGKDHTQRSPDGRTWS